MLQRTQNLLWNRYVEPHTLEVSKVWVYAGKSKRKERLEATWRTRVHRGHACEGGDQAAEDEDPQRRAEPQVGPSGPSLSRECTVNARAYRKIDQTA